MSNATIAVSKSASARLTSVLTDALQKKAIDSGWPEEAAKAVSFDEDLEIQISSEYKEVVDLLEYGTETMTPQPVLRKFKSEIKDRIMPTLVEEMRESIPEIVSQI